MSIVAFIMGIEVTFIVCRHAFGPSSSLPWCQSLTTECTK